MCCHPHIYVRNTGTQALRSYGTRGRIRRIVSQEELQIVCVSVIRHAVALDDGLERSGVQREQHRPQNRTLGYALGQWSNCRRRVTYADILGAIGDVRLKPGEGFLSYAVLITKRLDQQYVVNRVDRTNSAALESSRPSAM